MVVPLSSSRLDINNFEKPVKPINKSIIMKLIKHVVGWLVALDLTAL